MTTSDYLTQLQQDREDLVDNLETMGITGLSGDETFTELVPEVLNISRGADLSDYFTSTISSGSISEGGYARMVKNIPSTTIVQGTDLSYGFYSFEGTTIPLLDTSNVTNMQGMFQYSNLLTSIPSLNTSNVTNMQDMFKACSNLTTIPLLDTSNVTNMWSIFENCSNLTSIPQINTSNNWTFNSAFKNCQKLTTVPIFNASSCLNFTDMFASTSLLNDTSLDNILQMCVSATAYTGTKTLYQLGFRSNTYLKSRIEALPHYQDFINAGWQIGY